MKCGYLIVVFCAFTGILSAPAVDEESTPSVSTTPQLEIKNEESETTIGPTSPKTEELPPTTVETVVASSPETTAEPEPTIAVATSSIVEDASSTVPPTEGLPVTEVPASAAPEVPATTISSEPELIGTTTAETWFSSWFASTNSETGTTEPTRVETTETGTTPAATTEAGTTPMSTEVTVTSESSVSTTSESGTSVTAPTFLSTTPSSSSVLEKTKDVAFKLSDQVRAVLQHYKNPDPTGFPGAPVPDPMPIPDMDKSFGVAKMNFKNVMVYGLSKFRIDQVNTDLEKMEVYVQLHMKRLVVVGNYTLRSWFNKAAGPFSVNLYDVVAEGAAALEPDEQGHLQASDTDMDMTFKDIDLDFKNIGFAGSFFQGMVSSVGTFLFDSIKPYILNEVNTNMRRDVNAKIKTITSKLPSYVSPVDLAISEGRKYVVKMGYDPYHLKDFEFNQSILHINVSELWLKGLSQFYRVGEVALSMDSNVVQIGLQLVTKELLGGCSWTVSLGRRGKLARTGVSNFTVQHLQIRAFVNQSLDIRHAPILDDLDVEVGKVKLTMDGRGSLDYVIELVVNQLPDLIRHIIVDALEEPIRLKVQSILDQVNLEEIVESKLPELDNFTGAS
nr:PREDICTED: uncharacterized protein LOC109034796 isoform X1 [Bemisia tabaci]XP_018903701.1 PREDICTED: uncharacterized protein LOC109034796 isoform X2 [Bemisia tabaci]XP_018903711.1 PREDICTED: uncharacterized protein LOC109034796 isoform X3 [Bemisia tabaci]